MSFDEAHLTTATTHRPWPLPTRPWIMVQRWNDLLFMHWPVARSILETLVPAPLELDLHDGTAWLSVTPFVLSNLHLRGTPALPWLSTFPEVNVRTYVRYGGKGGVFFFSLDAGSLLAVIGARALFRLPYHEARMSVQTEGGEIRYTSNRQTREPSARLDVRYAPTGPVLTAEAGSLDHWLTERYCLYTVTGRDVLRTDIHHLPWPLQPARVELHENTMATVAGISVPAISPRVSFARRLDVLVWNPQRPADG